MNKEKVVYTYYLALKQKEILPLEMTWRNMEGIMLNGIARHGRTNAT